MWNIILQIVSHPLTTALVIFFLSQGFYVWLESRRRRHKLLEDLVATRTDYLSIEHIRAVSAVPIVFNRKKDLQVRTAYHDYVTHLQTGTGGIDEEAPQKTQEAQFTLGRSWNEITKKKRNDLIFLIAHRLGFKCDRSYLDLEHAPGILAMKDDITIYGSEVIKNILNVQKEQQRKPHNNEH